MRDCVESVKTMKLKELLRSLPGSLAEEIQGKLPRADVRHLLARLGASVEVTGQPWSVHKKQEAEALLGALRASDDLDLQRLYLSGWLAPHAALIVAFLDAWGVEHVNGVTLDFAWVARLREEDVASSLRTVAAAASEPLAVLLYFAYLELPFAGRLLEVERILASRSAPAPGQPGKP